ncbi:HWE histidine kinase domain-containing protein [Sphingomicrobium clamense]|uniref:histidine kinase n=1 Tax=Sphingomicrobium clamense TaxID=2851013 RepID=A0ABS6V7T1_9SPHN|nr:HWE histidine kinase domain-containing protein [Sphingomicrobium sp. B8]MBW0145400.1 PAS domain S-box protein [Sphingomicrobium sp. B8]
MDTASVRATHSAMSIDVAIKTLAATADLVGEDIFPALVEGISKSLGVRWVFLSRPSDNDKTKAETLAVWSDGPAENIVYDLAGSPCADIIGDGPCCYTDDVQSLFPQDALLREMGAQSYVGIPLRSSTGEVIGLLAGVNDRPIGNPDLSREILALFAGRAASELERISTSSSHERMGRIVEASVSEAFVFDGDTCRFELVNRGARENLGYCLTELQKLTPWDIKPEFSEEQFRDFVAPLKAGEVPFLEFETIHERKDGSHYDVFVRLQYFGGADNIFFASIFDITERKMAEERERLLMREVNHRAKNLLSIIQVVARQTAAAGLDDFADRFEDRIAALAKSHDLLVENPKEGVSLRDLVCAQLGHFSQLFGSRVKIDGPIVRLKSAAAQSIGMALHELSTNAAKYGSLSNDDGSVEIEWQIKHVGNLETFKLTWQEMNGPEVVPPTKTGFGSTLIASSLRASLRGAVEIDYARAGLHVTVTAPYASLTEMRHDEKPKVGCKRRDLNRRYAD